MTRLPTPGRVREDRLRRMAVRQGLKLVKSKRRDPLAIDYGNYQILSAESSVVFESQDLDKIEQWLKQTRGVVLAVMNHGR